MQAASGSSSEGSLLFGSNSEASDSSFMSDSADSEDMPSKPSKGSSADEDASEENQADSGDEAGLSSSLSSDGSDIETKQAGVARRSKPGSQGVCHLETTHCQYLPPNDSISLGAQVFQALAWHGRHGRHSRRGPEAWRPS